MRLFRAARPLANTTTQTARFSAAARRMVEGGQGDAFQKREEASENLYVRQQEKEKAAALRAKIQAGEAETKKHKEELEKLGKEQK